MVFDKIDSDSKLAIYLIKEHILGLMIHKKSNQTQ